MVCARSFAGGLVLAWMGWAALALGAEPKESPAATDLLAAVEAGDIEVKIIPRDEKVGTVIVTNKTARPLAIKLPGALAGIPVAAQFQPGLLGPNLFGNNPGNNGNGNASQGLGVAVRPPGGQPNNFGPAIFNVGPERAIKLKFTAVCLEHGKRSPNTRIPYRLAPLTDFTTDVSLIAVVNMLDRREIDQPTAQAAAWHLADGMSWEKLAKRIGVRHLNGVNELFFTADQIEAARDAVAEAQRRAAGSVATTSVTSQQR